jgi:hypothetical protein
VGGLLSEVSLGKKMTYPTWKIIKAKRAGVVAEHRPNKYKVLSSSIPRTIEKEFLCKIKFYCNS